MSRICWSRINDAWAALGNGAASLSARPVRVATERLDSPRGLLAGSEVRRADREVMLGSLLFIHGIGNGDKRM
ncbi:hypothetical protein GCM10027452_04480 [Micromonospora halotolerans]